MATVKVKLDDSIIVKRFICRPNLVVTPFILGPGYIAIENQVHGCEVGKYQSLQVLVLQVLK